MIEFKYGKFNFSGLPIQRYETYPWNSKKEKADFYKKLIDDGSVISKEKVKYFLKKESEESIHINFSRCIISLFTLGICTLLLFFSYSPINLIIISIINAICSFFILISYSKARREYMNYNMIDVMIDTIFELEKTTKK